MVRDWQGVVLCGGSSSRMGVPKGLLPVAGTTLGVYLGRLLAEASGRPPLLVGEGPVGEAPSTWARIPDRDGVSGPLAGLMALEADFADQPLIVLAVDLPAMNLDALRWLLHVAETAPDRALAVWPLLPGRPFGEPLASLYLPGALPVMARHWRNGARAVHRSLDESQRFQPPVPPALIDAFSGVNSPEDWFERTGTPLPKIS